jgi:hypothetical protein
VAKARRLPDGTFVSIGAAKGGEFCQMGCEENVEWASGRRKGVSDCFVVVAKSCGCVGIQCRKEPLYP